MIAYLRGIILEKTEKYLILQTNDIGYQVFTTSNLLSEIKKGDSLEFFIHTHVREDNITLYGFSRFNELQFFELLLTVSGIGPKIALEILNSPIEQIQNAIFHENLAVLTSINGLGKKTAQRLILELKNKVQLIDGGSVSSQKIVRNIDQDVINALESLGYSRYHIVRVLSKMDGEVQATEEIIRYFLQNV